MSQGSPLLSQARAMRVFSKKNIAMHCHLHQRVISLELEMKTKVALGITTQAIRGK